jgi:hypothetical protein
MSVACTSGGTLMIFSIVCVEANDGFVLAGRKNCAAAKAIASITSTVLKTFRIKIPTFSNVYATS